MAIIPLGRPLPAGSSSLPTGLGESPLFARAFANAHTRLCGLAPDGVCHAKDVAALAVGFYPAVSPLPASSRGRWFLFCCTLLGVTATGRYPASHSMELGLSSREARSVHGLSDVGDIAVAGDRLPSPDAPNKYRAVAIRKQNRCGRIFDANPRTYTTLTLGSGAFDRAGVLPRSGPALAFPRHVPLQFCRARKSEREHEQRRR